MLLQLVRWPARRYEMDLVKIESPVRRSCYRQMPRMDWVERATKQRNSSWMMLCCSAMRLRRRQCAPRKFILLILSRFFSLLSRFLLPARPCRPLLAPRPPQTHPLPHLRTLRVVLFQFHLWDAVQSIGNRSHQFLHSLTGWSRNRVEFDPFLLAERL